MRAFGSLLICALRSVLEMLRSAIPAAYYPQMTGHAVTGHCLVMPCPESLALSHATYLPENLRRGEDSRFNSVGAMDAERYSTGFHQQGLLPAPFSNELPHGLLFDNELKMRMTALFHATRLPEVHA